MAKIKAFISAEIEVEHSVEEVHDMRVGYHSSEAVSSTYTVEWDSSIRAYSHHYTAEIITKMARSDIFVRREINTLKKLFKFDKNYDGDFTHHFIFNNSCGHHLNIAFFYDDGKTREYYAGRGWKIRITGINITNSIPFRVVVLIHNKFMKKLKEAKEKGEVSEEAYNNITQSFFRKTWAKAFKEIRYKREKALAKSNLSKRVGRNKYTTWHYKYYGGFGEVWEWRSFNVQGVRTFKELETILTLAVESINEVIDKLEDYEFGLVELKDIDKRLAEGQTKIIIKEKINLANKDNTTRYSIADVSNMFKETLNFDDVFNEKYIAIIKNRG